MAEIYVNIEIIAVHKKDLKRNQIYVLVMGLGRIGINAT